MSTQLNIFDYAPGDHVESDIEPVEVDADWLGPNDCFVGPLRCRMQVCVGPNQRAADELKKVTDEVYAITNDYRAFETCCEMWWATLERYSGGEARYMELVGKWPAEAVRVASKGMGVLLNHFVYGGGFDDLLGRVYMQVRSDWGGKYMGQYFTPWALARAMARLSMGGLDQERLECGPAYSLADDCGCGSGVMLLAARSYVAEKFGRRALRNVLVHGVDKDQVCVTMCRIQMRMTNVPWMMNFLAATYSDMARGVTP